MAAARESKHQDEAPRSRFILVFVLPEDAKAFMEDAIKRVKAKLYLSIERHIVFEITPRHPQDPSCPELFTPPPHVTLKYPFSADEKKV